MRALAPISARQYFCVMIQYMYHDIVTFNPADETCHVNLNRNILCLCMFPSN